MATPEQQARELIDDRLTASGWSVQSYRDMNLGAGRPHLGFEHLEQTLVALPPLDEQSAVIEAATEKLSQIDALEVEVTRGLTRAGRLRQAILKAAFEGKLVPQDSSDEPASALLERLRTMMQLSSRRWINRRCSTEFQTGGR